MQVTIDIRVLIQAISTIVMLGSIAVLLYLHFKSKQMSRKQEAKRKEFNASFQLMSKEARDIGRYLILFRDPLRKHLQTHPGDITCIVTFGKPRNESGFTHLYHAEGPANMTDWKQGIGLETLHLLRNDLMDMEKNRPGMLRLLQPMLDEALDTQSTPR